MIEVLRRKLWETIYLNPVTPAELMKNLTDPDYTSVECVNLDRELRITLSFKDDGELIKTVYSYDSNNLLQNVVMQELDTQSVIFNRQEEIKVILNEISNCKNEYLLTESCSA